jgi:uncharacterized membrane protein
MNNLVVITFNREHEARDARKAVSSLARQGLIRVDDAAVIMKDPDGKVHVDNELESSTKTGAVVGGLLGAVLFFLFPLAGIALGALGGALVGKSIEPGVDQGFVRDVTTGLKPGGSALFLMFHGADQDAALAALRPFQGTLYHTTLSPEAEESLRHALE